MRRLNASDPFFDLEFDAFLADSRGAERDVDASVAAIIAAVRSEGLPAVLRFTAQFDKLDVDEKDLRVSPEEIAAGVAACPPEVREALAFAAARIRNYHERIRPADGAFIDDLGVELGWRWTPLDAVGIYVPGGRAAYPSTVLMNAVPAQVAGVGRIAMATPPGMMQPAVLAAAVEAGVTEIWRVGGAQAIAALAYGAGPIKAVDKIVGPGNTYVAAAKRRVFGAVGIDCLAGPSEIVVVADEANNAEWIAADLLSQAEHDPAAQSILITDDADFAAAVESAVLRQLLTLKTAEDAKVSWREHGAIIIAPMHKVPQLIDRIAPEHVELAVHDAKAMSARIRHAGAVFTGRYAPEAIGDYVAGSNHVLPTSRTARYSSGLSTLDFLKRTSLIGCDIEAFAGLARATAVLADIEGLPAHARSVTIRLNARD
jgi:histidinol dehydrogenase